MLVDVDPYIFRIGALGVRWYGLMVAASIMAGLYIMVTHGRRRGLDEDYMYTAALSAVIGGVIGARALYVLTNLPAYSASPIDMFRVWHGGLSWHGALLGGIIGGYLVARRAGGSFGILADLAVPGLSIGYILVRLANIVNKEVLGRAAEIISTRHPTQLYGSAIGVVLLLLNIHLARTKRPPGWLFWAFIFYYSLLRGVVEETFRANPLYIVGYVNETWGIGLFTLTHIITPPLMLLAWWLMRRVYLVHTGR